MKKFFFILLLILLFIYLQNCSVPEENIYEGDLVIRTPSKITPSMRNIIGNSGTEIDTERLSQNRMRYDIIIESRGRRIDFLQLKNNDSASIEVPSGIPITIQVGVYYAKNSSSFDETYNVYLAWDSIENIKIMPGSVKNLQVNLDLSKTPRVESYFISALGSKGIASISGGIIATDGNPYFSAYSLETSGDSHTVLVNGYTYAKLDLTNSTVIDPVMSTGKGRLFELIDPFDNNHWYVHETDIYRSWSGSTGYRNGFGIDLSNVTGKLDDIRASYYAEIDVNSDNTTDSFNDEFYIFFSYPDGFLATDRTQSLTPQWADMTDNRFNSFSKSYPFYDFLLDIDSDISPYHHNVFFTTKLGLYYIHYSTLQVFTRTGTSSAMKDLKKHIKITHPFDSSKNLLITKVNAVNNTVYLGTIKGLYRIDKNSSKWRSFANASFTSDENLSENIIEKYDKLGDEPVIFLEHFSIDNDTILVAASNNKIWFRNKTDRKEDIITVKDGMPFTPSKKYSNDPELNDVYYKIHLTAKINTIMWDNSHRKFWIATDYGYASIEYDDLF